MQIIKSAVSSTRPYITKDRSEIRELIHPRLHGSKNQSLAEAVVAPGVKTALHRHPKSEEIYHFLEGKGVMILGEKMFDVASGDSVCILPGTPHCVRNTGRTPLRLLCCCAPAYAHEDTELL